MPILTPAQLETQYTSALTAEELAELELLYARLNESLQLSYKEDVDEYEFEIESDTFSIYPERVTNQIEADILAASWSECLVETFVIPTVTESRQYRGIKIWMKI